MNNNLDLTNYNRFASRIAAFSPQQLENTNYLIEQLTIAHDSKVRVAYCPFEATNTQAKLMIVGITPGPTQLKTALSTFKSKLLSGTSPEETLLASKMTGAFSGPLRKNLIALLDESGVDKLLGVSNCSALFSTHRHLVQTTSLIGNATFLLNGKPYNGTPNPLNNHVLKQEIENGFLKQIRANPSAYILTLGKEVDDVLKELCDQGKVDESRVLLGMPHPAPGNVERVHYFLRKKTAKDLSSKTNPAILDARKNALTRKIDMLRAL